MRRVAQWFQPVEGGSLGRIVGGVGVDDDDPAPRRAAWYFNSKLRTVGG
jgi:hypothetical protein